VNDPRVDSPPRIQFRSLGPIDLIDPAGAEVRALLGQPKRLALLIYLALAPAPFFRRRDSVIGLFWPELDEEHARGALRQALSYLRHSLGAKVIQTRGTDEIGVSRDLVQCDVHDFEAAVTAGADESALAHYTGDFLEGVQLSDVAQEFDEWIASERARLRAKARDAARRLARAASAAADAAMAESWARRAYALAGRDETDLVRLLELLDTNGERAGALRLYEDFVRRLKIDVDAEPSPETRALIERIRARTLAVERASDPAGHGPAPTRQPLRTSADARDGRARRRISVLAGAGTAALAVALTAGVVLANHQRVALDPRRVAVARFENRTGDATLDPLGDVAADYIARGLAETRLVTVVDARAGQRDDAGSVVRGSYYRHADSLTFEVELIDVRTGSVIQPIQRADAPAAKPAREVASLAQRVMTAIAVRFDPLFADYQGASQPSSYEAYQEFLAGDQYRLRENFACKSDCYGEEIAHYRRAFSLDTNFTLALASEAWSSLLVGACARTDSIAAYLQPRHDRLATLDRLTLDGAVALCHGERTRALEFAREALAASPHSEAAALTLGLEARRAGLLRESVALMGKLDPARVGSHRHYWSNLEIPYHLLGEHARELEVASGSRRAFPNRTEAIAFEARAFVGLGRLPEMRKRLDEMVSVPTNALQVRVVAVRLDEVAGDLDAHGYTAEARVVYERAAAWCRSRPAEELKGSEDDCGRAFYYAGQFEKAREVFARLAREDPQELQWQSFLGVVAARMGDRKEVGRVDRWLAARTGPYLAGAPTFERARIAAVLGDRERAVTLLRLAIDQGATVFGTGFGLHADPDFRSLRGYPPFDELLRPKG
jgi:DNA-binding SARP family transcriptional activator